MTSVGPVSVMAMVVVASVVAAMVKPGLKTIPAIVRSMSEQERLEEPARLVLHTAAFLSARGADRSEIAHPLTDAKGRDQAAFERPLDACLDLHLLEGGEVVRMHQLLAMFVASVRPEGEPCG